MRLLGLPLGRAVVACGVAAAHVLGWLGHGCVIALACMQLAP